MSAEAFAEVFTEAFADLLADRFTDVFRDVFTDVLMENGLPDRRDDCGVSGFAVAHPYIADTVRTARNS
ncbi:hypothetical protein GCM10010433_55140 [Streptomyces pulveraceus]